MSLPGKKRVLILSDGSPGHFNQSIALCRHLNLDYEITETGFPTAFHKILSYALDWSRIKTDRLFNYDQPRGDYSFVVSAGSSTNYPNKVIAGKLGIPSVIILLPSGYRRDYDCIVTPSFDRPKPAPNVLEVPINLCYLDRETLEQNRTEVLNRHQPRKTPWGILIGGSDHVSDMRVETIKEQLDQIVALAKGKELWVTTSRRTPPEVEDLLQSYPFDFQVVFSRDPFNPIPTFIDSCEYLFITSDSTSMISESVSYGNSNVEILMNRQKRIPNKFLDFIESLAAKNCVHVFQGQLERASRKIDLGTHLKKIIPMIGKNTLSHA